MAVRDVPRAQQEKPQSAWDGKNPPGYLGDLLEETRILLPGTQIFAGFLIELPFTNRFAQLTAAQRNLYVITFVAVLLALVFFIAPAAYHRIARPIHQKQAYKVLATWFCIIGLVPFSISTVLAAYFIVDVVIGAPLALAIGACIGVSLAVLWWLFPLLRIHDYIPTKVPEDE